MRHPMHPSILYPGARIGVFAPSGVHDAARLEIGLSVLRTWGLVPVLAPHVGRTHRYLSATDDERLADLQWALGAPDLDGAWMVRGGYGLARLVSRVDWRRVVPRPVVGFSDGTVLLHALWRRGIAGGVHGPVVQNLGSFADPASCEAVRLLLLEGRTDPWQGVVRVPGTARGPLVGGNLCTLASLAGTPEGLRARGAVVLLEEVSEAPYRVDRLFTQLVDAGGLAGAVGLVLGTFHDCAPPHGVSWTLEEVLDDLVRRLGIPVLADVPVGHGPRNHPFLLGAPVALEGNHLHFLPTATHAPR